MTRRNGGKRHPLPGDFRLGEPERPCGWLRSSFRKLVGRLMEWRIGHLERSVEDRMYELACRCYGDFEALYGRMRAIEEECLGARVARLEKKLSEMESMKARTPASGDVSGTVPPETVSGAGEPAVASGAPVADPEMGGIRREEIAEGGACEKAFHSERREEELSMTSGTRSCGFDFGLRFRGDDEVLVRRCSEYVRMLPARGLMVDLGCGRGAMLAARRDAGGEGVGVDVDTRACAHCRELGLDVREGDALGFLRKLAPRSVSAITAVHVLEHMSPATVVELLAQSARCLADGGRILVEVPNPTTLAGLVSHFVDPDHRTVLHPATIRYMLEAAGFRILQSGFRDPVDGEQGLLPLPVLPLRELADFREALRVNLEILERTVFGHLSFFVLAGRPSPDGVSDGRTSGGEEEP